MKRLTSLCRPPFYVPCYAAGNRENQIYHSIPGPEDHSSVVFVPAATPREHAVLVSQAQQRGDAPVTAAAYMPATTMAATTAVVTRVRGRRGRGRCVHVVRVSAQAPPGACCA